ncbi:membrane hypothetical protein [[Clostridium] ultunense Esp]|uniref:Uncharacterized protein n=1 Tax=[Clostridium] ultunense Esp TaxID=1288971 RepID=M1ZD97_9FIRM|nr:hypothetical protein [Schnuerera ultunensis]CCQ95873.1 membrane hypothetical protein [[Clostridium] ultunense Esp]SHD78021.1 conserved membrane protein of unknown function [[Clostridium] ultunense Esp]
MEAIVIPKEFYIAFFKFIFGFIIFIFIYEILTRYLFDFSIKLIKSILILTKVLFYGFLLFFSLFYDFELKSISLMLPESISFTQLIMVPITGFEMVSNIVDLFEVDNYLKK